MKKLLTALLLVIATAPAFAISSDDLLVREYSKKSNAEFRDYNDATLLNITYTGSSTECIVGITLDSLTTATPYGTADLTIDMSAAAYDTLGEVCDYLNAQDGYSCALNGGKRNDDSSITTNITATVVTTDAKASGGYYLVDIDSGSAVSDGSVAYINRIGVTPESGKRVVLKYCNVTNDGTGSLNVYGKLAKYASVSDGVTRNDTTLVSSIADVDDTAKIVGNIYGGYWIEFAKDEHVVISAGNASVAQTATSSLECFWDEK